METGHFSSRVCVGILMESDACFGEWTSLWTPVLEFGCSVPCTLGVCLVREVRFKSYLIECDTCILSFRSRREEREFQESRRENSGTSAVQ